LRCYLALAFEQVLFYLLPQSLDLGGLDDPLRVVAVDELVAVLVD
jgi:hypothetical protein